MNLDKNDPYLRRNLNRLEDRFRERYYSSVQRNLQRKKKGKSSHKATIRSIEDNKKRFEEVRRIRHKLLGDPLNLSLKRE